MKRTVMPLIALAAMLVGTGRVAAADPPLPDLTGNWFGTFASGPRSIGKAAMSINYQDGGTFEGALAVGHLVFDIQGSAIPDPTYTEADPPGEIVISGFDRLSGAMIYIRGTVRFADPPNPDTDPPGEIIAYYLIIGPDGSTQFGTLALGELSSIR